MSQRGGEERAAHQTETMSYQGQAKIHMIPHMIGAEKLDRFGDVVIGVNSYGGPHLDAGMCDTLNSNHIRYSNEFDWTVSVPPAMADPHYYFRPVWKLPYTKLNLVCQVGFHTDMFAALFYDQPSEVLLCEVTLSYRNGELRTVSFKAHGEHPVPQHAVASFSYDKTVMLHIHKFILAATDTPVSFFFRYRMATGERMTPSKTQDIESLWKGLALEEDNRLSEFKRSARMVQYITKENSLVVGVILSVARCNARRVNDWYIDAQTNMIRGVLLSSRATRPNLMLSVHYATTPPRIRRHLNPWHKWSWQNNFKRCRELAIALYGLGHTCYVTAWILQWDYQMRIQRQHRVGLLVANVFASLARIAKARVPTRRSERLAKRSKK